ncbi:MAG: Gfo/Idh/MocA family oxidoreductase [Thermodesulfobacteriota bacterium]
MRKLKVGLIGLGKVAESHLAGYREVDCIEVVSGAEVSRERLRQMTDKWGLRGYLDPEEMIARESLDLVCILTPPSTHRRLTELAAARGLHVLCEKPLALSLEDGRAMISAAERAGVKLYYGSSYRCLPAVIKARQMIAAGEVGHVALMIETFIGGGGPEKWIDLGPHHYPLDGPGGGGMGLVDHGIHLADIIPWLAGSEIRAVFGRGNYSGRKPGPEYLTMVLENGAVGQLLYHEATYPAVMPGEGIFSLGASWDVLGNIVPGGDWDHQPQNIQVYGDQGALRIFHYANQLFFFHHGGVKQVQVLDRPNPGHFGLQIETFAACITKDEPPPVTGNDGLKALQVILAAYRSAENKEIVSLET